MSEDVGAINAPDEEAEEIQKASRTLLRRIDEATLGELRILAQGIRLGHDSSPSNPGIQPRTAKAFEQSEIDLERAAKAIVISQREVGGQLTTEQLPEHLARKLAEGIAAEVAEQPKVRIGRTAA